MGFGKVLDRLATPPTTVLHGSFFLENLKFTHAPFHPMVAAEEWQFVCRGRGAFDFASLLTSCMPPEDRLECERRLMIYYLNASGYPGDAASKAEFELDVRAGLLANLGLFLMRH